MEKLSTPRGDFIIIAESRIGDMKFWFSHEGYTIYTNSQCAYAVKGCDWIIATAEATTQTQGETPVVLSVEDNIFLVQEF